MLSQEQISDYHRDGFVLIEDALLPQQLHELQMVTAQFIERSRSVTQSDDVFDLDKGHSADTPRLTRIKSPHLQHDVFKKLLFSERITSIMRSVLGQNVRLHNSKLNTKAPGGGAAVEWHQDWAFYPHTNDDLLAMGIMLDDVSMDNGPLLAIPGSHKGPVLEHMANGVFSGAVDPADPLFDKSKAVALTGKAGSLSLHHVRTLHGSAPNLSDRPRMLLFFECSAADAWPIGGINSACSGMNQNAFWQFVSDRLICGEQTLQARLESVPVVMPLPPAPDSSSIFKVQSSSGARSAFDQ